MDATISNIIALGSQEKASWPYLSEVENAAQEAMRAHPGIGYAQVAPVDSSGIKVIIVGAGFAGLACAIECKRKGHRVLVLEKFSELKILGEFIHPFECLCGSVTSGGKLGPECRRCKNYRVK